MTERYICEIEQAMRGEAKFVLPRLIKIWVERLNYLKRKSEI